MTFIKRKGRTTFSVGKRGPRMSYRLGCAVPILALLLVAALTACGEANRYADIDSCDGLLAAFETEAVPEDAAERKALGDEYRERFRELDCSL